MNEYLEIFKALSARTRFRIVMMLQVKPLCVCEIRDIIGSSFSTISNHLRILAQAGVVNYEKDERYVNFTLARENPKVAAILDIISSVDDKQIKSDMEKAKYVSRFDKTVC